MDFHDIDDAQTTMSSSPPSPDSVSMKSFSSEFLGRSGSSCEWEEQKPFETFQDKVVQLCRDDGFGLSLPSHVPLTIPEDVDIIGYPFEMGGTSTNMPCFGQRSFASKLIKTLQMRKKHDMNRGYDFLDIYWDKLSRIAKEMDIAGFFSNAVDIDYVLWHWDLAFRNILVERQTGGNWQLTGVLDWDMLMAVPLVLTRAAPTRLWCEGAKRSIELFDESDDESQPSDELATDELYLPDYFHTVMQQADPN